MTGSLERRMREVLGADQLRGLPEFDPADPAQVDLLAAPLLERFFVQGDPEAFELLVTMSEPHVMRAAESILFEVGGAFPAETLLSDVFELVARGELEGVTSGSSFLRAVEGKLRELARLRVEIAASRRLLSYTETFPWYRDQRVSTPVSEEAEAAFSPWERDGREMTYDEYYTAVVDIAFHRLEVADRQILRAAEVEFRLPSDVGVRLGVDEDEAITRLRLARKHMFDATERVAERHLIGLLLELIRSLMKRFNWSSNAIVMHWGDEPRPVRTVLSLIHHAAELVGDDEAMRLQAEADSPGALVAVSRRCVDLVEAHGGRMGLVRFWAATLCCALREFRQAELMLWEGLDDDLTDRGRACLETKLVYALIGQGRYGDAIETGRRFLEGGSEDLFLAYNVLAAHSRAGDWDGFRDAARTVLRLEESNSEVLRSTIQAQGAGFAAMMGRTAEEVFDVLAQPDVFRTQCA